MSFVTVALFLAVVVGLGLGLLALARLHLLEAVWIAPVAGLGAIPLAFLSLRLAHVPLDWRLVLALAALGAAVFLLRRRRDRPPAPRLELATPAAVLVAVALAGLMFAGARSYAHLEDDDPWDHAAGARWVALERTTAQPSASAVSHYLEPYPPFYTATMGVLHQTNDDLRWVLKLFNALMVGLSALAAYHLVREATGSPSQGLAAAAMLAASPAWMTHFIWAQTLALPVFLCAVWALLRLEHAPGPPLRSGPFWMAVLLAWSATIVQPSTAVIAALLLTTIGIASGVSRWRRERRVGPVLLAVVAGGVPSFLTWAWLATTHGWEPMRVALGIASEMFSGTSDMDTSGGLVYGLRDIVQPGPVFTQKIDQSTGIGWGICALALAGILRLALRWRRGQLRPGGFEPLVLVWLAIGLVGIEGNALPVRLFPHRFWPFLAIPVAVLAAQGAGWAGDLVRRERWRWAPTIALAAAAAATVLGPRIAMQTSWWPPGIAWKSYDHLGVHLQLSEQLPRWTRVMSLCSKESLLIGVNLAAEPWDPELVRLKAELGPDSAGRVLAFMRAREYRYLVVDPSCMEKLGDRALPLWQGLIATGALRESITTNGTVALERM
jgi:hypothetical protein